MIKHRKLIWFKVPHPTPHVSFSDQNRTWDFWYCHCCKMVVGDEIFLAHYDDEIVKNNYKDYCEKICKKEFRWGAKKGFFHIGICKNCAEGYPTPLEFYQSFDILSRKECISILNG